MRFLYIPTLIEWAVIAGIVVTWCCLWYPDSRTQVRWSLERQVNEWQPKPASKLDDVALIATDINIAGDWLERGRHHSTSFSFSPLASGSFDAQFKTHGCSGGAAFSRQATWRAGTIRLDRAVADILGRTYDTLYAMRLDGTEYLLPSACVENFEQELASGNLDWSFGPLQRQSTADGAKE